MEDFQLGRLAALSAHVEGLEAALQALDSEETSGASLRRIARSLTKAARDAGAPQLVELATAVSEAGEEDLEGLTRDLLEHVATLRRTVPRDQIHVLVVEDDRTAAAAVQAYLTAPDRTLHHAATAEEAESILGAHPIDVVVLDLILPDRDGRDLLLQLREDPDTVELPVIVLSSKAGAVAKAECLAVGASDFLEKPADPPQLREAVNRQIDRRGSRELARRDEATGLLNRAGLAETFRAALAELGEGAPMAVTLLAIEYAGAGREHLDTAALDGLLVRVSREVRAELAAVDVLGRWGPAELLLLFPGGSASEAREKLKSGLDRLASADLEQIHPAGASPSFSAGVVEAEPDQDFREVVESAEVSLYRARESGQGVVLGRDEGHEGTASVVLLVEDDRVTATLIQHRLVREGFEVMDFLNGEEAYHWALESSFDLAILDVKVPGMDGFELLEKLRAMPRHASVPIVMLTGLGSEADVVRGLELGANDYVLKPFSPTELLARARRLIHARTAGASAPAASASPTEAEAN